MLGDMRLIRNGDGKEELYDFARDRADSFDLAASPERRDVLAALRLALARFAPGRNRPPQTLDSSSAASR
jgi:hypothetical protein